MIQEQNLLGKILSNTRYDAYMYNDLSGGQWADSISCLERWESIKQLIESIDAAGDVISRIIFMKEKISEAMSIYNLLPEEIFDSKSKSTHLLGWIEGLDKFKEIIEGM